MRNRKWEEPKYEPYGYVKGQLLLGLIVVGIILLVKGIMYLWHLVMG